MNVLFISPEVFPFARAGGLGDVSYYLPRALVDRGHRLWVITPKYRHAEEAGYELTEREESVRVSLPGGEKIGRIFSVVTEKDVEIFFIGCDDLYNREGLYGNEFGDYEDNAERFIFFNRAAMEVVKAFGLRPDVIHCHDWPSGMIPVYTKTLYKTLPGAGAAATLFTFHNLGSQGIFWHYDYAMTGLDWEYFTPEGLEFHGQLNMTKAGLVAADLINTVSRKYALEVLTPEFAFGLEGVLAARKKDTYAVLNGVDYTVWDPETDPLLAASYSAETLLLKEKCRDELAQSFNLAQDDRPILAVISRLLDRKGFDLIKAGLDQILDLPLKMVIMGMGEDKYHVLLHDLAASHPNRVGVNIAYDKDMAHRLIAGADIFLMPSRYEPCGLEQLYALKYGTVPVVRATGGLDDTVVDVGLDPNQGTGFKFEDYTPQALIDALAAAVKMFSDKPAWQAMMRRGMACDFSWSRAAEEYEDLYRKAVQSAPSKKWPEK